MYKRSLCLRGMDDPTRRTMIGRPERTLDKGQIDPFLKRGPWPFCKGLNLAHEEPREEECSIEVGHHSQGIRGVHYPHCVENPDVRDLTAINERKKKHEAKTEWDKKAITLDSRVVIITGLLAKAVQRSSATRVVRIFILRQFELKHNLVGILSGLTGIDTTFDVTDPRLEAALLVEVSGGQHFQELKEK
ncbi:hypothetical protein Cgig2_002664 [Carnegiea gigantea]|uniref:Uncharacterized protein n=1 Tax=Carnegiea gigantea TaxID=171969 RepID=A0A9Q1K3G5_9CARY|nr:hypothetical protein Cgig2_002664 [Carnegiea gigantea]